MATLIAARPNKLSATFFQLTSRGRSVTSPERLQRVETIRCDLRFIGAIIRPLKARRLPAGRTGACNCSSSTVVRPCARMSAPDSRFGRHADEAAVEAIGPRVIGAGQPPGAARPPSTSREARWRQILWKARTSPSSPRNTITLSPRDSSVCHSPGEARSLSGRRFATTDGSPAPSRPRRIRDAVDPAGKAQLRLGCGGKVAKGRHEPSLANAALFVTFRIMGLDQN